MSRKKKARRKKKSTPVALVDELLAAWTTSRDPDVGELLIRLGPQVYSDSMAPLHDAHRTQDNIEQKLWLSLEQSSSPCDRDILARTLFNATIKESKARMKLIEKWPPDPRVASIFAHDLATLPKTSYATQPLYNGMMRILGRCGDVRAAQAVAAIDVTQYIAMPDFFEERIPKLVEKMKAFTHESVDDAALKKWREATTAILGDDAPKQPSPFAPIAAPTATPKLDLEVSHALCDGLVQWAQRAGERTLFTFSSAREQSRRVTRDVTAEFVVVERDQVLCAGRNEGVVRMSDDGLWLAAVHRDEVEDGPHRWQLRVWNLETNERVFSDTIVESKQCVTALSFREGALWAAFATDQKQELVRIHGGTKTTIVTDDSGAIGTCATVHAPDWIVHAHAHGLWVIDASTHQLRHALDVGWVHAVALAPGGKLLVKSFSGGTVTAADPGNKTLYLGQLDLATAGGEWERECPTGAMSYYDYDPQLAVAGDQGLFITGPDVSHGTTKVRTVVESGFAELLGKNIDTDAVRGNFVALGEHAFAGGTEGTARWFSLPSLEAVDERRGFVESAREVGVSADGSVVAAWRWRKADVWGAKTKRISSSSDYGFTSMVVSDDGRVGLASGHTMKLYSSAGKKLASFKAKTTVFDARYCSERFFLASANGVDVFEPDGTLVVKMGERIAVRSLAVRPDAQLIVGAGNDVLHVWSQSGGALHESAIAGVKKVAFATDGSVLILVDDELRRVSDTLKPLETLATEVSTFATSRNGWLAVAHRDGTIRVRGAGKAAELTAFGPVHALALGDDCLVVGHAIAGTRGTVNVYAL